MSQTTLIVFAKAPIAGQVKTRLIPVLGQEGATALYRRLLSHQLAVIAPLKGVVVELWAAPDCDHPFLRELATRHPLSCRSQQGRGLGERMQIAFAATLPLGPVLLVGSDIPSLTLTDYQTAIAALEQGSDAVFIPTEDGGYALIGLNRLHNELFADIDWGSERVMEQTRERLDGLGWQWRELERRWDIDEPADLERLNGSFRYLRKEEAEVADEGCPMETPRDR